MRAVLTRAWFALSLLWCVLVLSFSPQSEPLLSEVKEMAIPPAIFLALGLMVRWVFVGRRV